MSRLGPCLLKHAKILKDFDTKEITEATRTYIKNGMDEHAAERKAVDDKLAELKSERARVERDILEQYKAMRPDAIVEPLTLETQTKAELQAKKDAEGKAAKDKADAEAKQAAQDAKDQEKKYVQARNEQAADNFQLGQSAADNLSGQGSMFSRKAATPIDEKTALAHSIDPEDVPVGKWAGRVMFHGTDQNAAADITANGASAEKSSGGYFGKGLYLAADYQLAKNNYADFRDDGEQPAVIAVRIKGNANVLDLRSPDAWDQYQKITNNGRLSPSSPDFHRQMVKAGVDGLFDRSFGGVVMFNDKAVEPMKFGGAALFSRKATDEKDLIVQHNLSIANLYNVDKMGGMAVPSLAITKAAHPLESFGEISLIGPPEMADPKGYANTKVFGADVYSPRYPEVTYRLDAAALKRLNAALSPYMESTKRGIYGGEITKTDDLMQHEAFEKMMLAKTGEKDIWRVSRSDKEDVANQMLKDAGATEHLFRGYNYNGNRTYKAHTLENVVKILKKEIRGGEGFNYGVGSLRAKYTPQFKSLAQIKANKGRLVSKADFEAVKNEVDDELVKFANSIAPYYLHDSERFGFLDTTTQVLEDAGKMGFTRAFEENQFENVPAEVIKEGRDYLAKLRELPTEYFEAKILREVDLAEFSAAVIPDNTPQRARDILAKRGLQVFEYKKGDEGSRQAAIQQAAEAKNALFSRAPTFYSALTRAVENSKTNSAPAIQWIGSLKNMPGVKPDEIQWSGITQWLQDQKGAKVTKQQVIDYLKTNEVQVKDVTLGDKDALLPEEQRKLQQLQQEYSDDPDSFTDADYQEMQAMEERLGLPGAWNDQPAAETKFASYQLPGGENYRELLLTLPKKESSPDFSTWDAAYVGGGQWRIYDAEGVNRGTVRQESDADKLDVIRGWYQSPAGSGFRFMQNKEMGNFQSSHFDQPNILAHVRFNERTDAEGKRVLFIEEVQSDWAQSGRKRGFAPPTPPRNKLHIMRDIDAVTDALRERTGRYLPTPEDWIANPDLNDRHTILAAEYDAAGKGGTTPAAPFVAKTEAWTALALKRMIRYAAENGFDKIAWTTGTQQAERYDLSKQIKEIEYEKRPTEESNGTPQYRLSVTAINGDDVPSQGWMSLTEIENFAGKEIAKKIENGEGKHYRGHEGRTLEGLDLKVGGSGMIGFYDKIIPATLNKYVKQWGGKVEETQISQDHDAGTNTEKDWDEAAARAILKRGGEIYVTDKFHMETRIADEAALDELLTDEGKPYGYILGDKQGSTTQPSITITPEMRESVMQGQPLFSKDKTGVNSTNDLPINEANREYTDRLEQHLRAQGHNFRATPVLPEYAVEHAGRGHDNGSGGQGNHFRLAEKVAGVFGKQIVWIRADGDFAINGVIVGRIANKIFIDVRTDVPAHVVAGHELSHWIEKDSPEIYSRLMRALDKVLIRHEEYRAKYNIPADATTADLSKEMVGDLMGDAFGDSQFWNQVAKENPGLIRGIADKIMQWLNDTIAKLQSLTGFGSERYVNDLKAARTALAKAVSEYALAKKGTSESDANPVYEQAYSRQSQTDTPAFRKWFGDSKVVDTNGNPLRVFHGTATPSFTTFKRTRGGWSGGMGIWFGSDPSIANEFAKPRFADQGPAVYPVYLRVNKPMQFDGWPAFTEAARATGKTDIGDMQRSLRNSLIRKGYDGIVIRGSDTDNGGTRDDWVAFEPDQIKSAIGNNGQFDASNPDIRFSRAAPHTAILNHLQSASTTKEMTGRIGELLQSDHTFNRLTKNINTQYHKAQLDKDFKRVFDAVQGQMADTEHYAIESEKLAPDILVRMQGFSDIGRTILQGGKQYAADLKAISQPLFANIEGIKGVRQFKYNDTELKGQWKLNDRQIAMYHQYQAATAQSIERLAQAKTLETIQTLGMDIAPYKDMSLEDTHQIARSAIFQAAEDKRVAATTAQLEPEEKAKLLDEAHQLMAIRDQVDTIKTNADMLVARGYTPAMRFGDYEVRGETLDENGKITTEYMDRFESQVAANAVYQALKKEHPDWRVTKGMINPNTYKLLRGVSPESFELMAQLTGNADDASVKQYIALAKSSRSASKRLLERQGIAGFSEDASRVLAAFVTSNARATAQALNSHTINEALTDEGLKRKGDVHAEAQSLVEYVSNPNEEASKLRGLLFMHYMGGSIASGLVNLTQPILQTAPHITKYLSAMDTFAVMRKAVKATATGNIPASLKAAFDKAEADGITEPHEIHQLMADAGGSTLGRNLRARAFVKAWGGFFSLSEAFNRKVTFLAAYETALKIGDAKVKAAGFNDAYSFARNAVSETQGIYNKGNRPNMARGAVGATLFTFKQFSIAYVEWLSRLPRKQQVIALSMLILASGLEGLPFAEDIEDLIDTIGHRLGYATNSRKQLRRLVAAAVGQDAAEYVLHGSSRLTALDLSGRLGMGNLIPGTAFFDPANKNKGREVLDVLGAAGGLAKGVSGAMDGDIAGTLPTALKNIAKAYQMADTGEYRDSKGRLVQKITGWDTIVKSIGFNPTDVAEANKLMGDAMNDIEIVRWAKSEIADEWARGVIEHKPDAVRKARAALTAWNLANPDYRIHVKESDINSRAKQARLTRDMRTIKAAPPGLRREVIADLR